MRFLKRLSFPCRRALVSGTPALVLAVALAGCVSTRRAAEYEDIRVGDVYELPSGAIIVRCQQFTLWGFPGSGNTDCIRARGSSQKYDVKSELPGPVEIKVYKIKYINAIDYVGEIIYVQVMPGGKKYVAGWDALGFRIARPSAP